MEPRPHPEIPSPDRQEAYTDHDIIDRTSQYSTPEELWNGLQYSLSAAFDKPQGLRGRDMAEESASEVPPYANNFVLMCYSDEYFTGDKLTEWTLLQPRRRLRDAVMEYVPEALERVRAVFGQFKDAMLTDAKIAKLKKQFTADPEGLAALQQDIYVVYRAALELVTIDDYHHNDEQGGYIPSAHEVLCR